MAKKPRLKKGQVRVMSETGERYRITSVSPETDPKGKPVRYVLVGGQRVGTDERIIYAGIETWLRKTVPK